MARKTRSKVRKALLLDKKAILLALILGLALAIVSIYYLVLMLVFLLLAVAVTKYGHYEKKEMGVYEHERGWENVIANGLMPLIAAIFLSPGAFFGALAAVMSDKFASELGILGGKPINLRNLKRTKKGTSGAMSPFGTLMSFNGALIIGFAVLFLFPLQYNLWHVVLIGAIGFLGSLVDSIFGVFEEAGIGNKTTTNIICSILGALLGFLFL